MNFLSVENISRSYGARVLFKDISFGIAEGQKMALVAKNGTGKTSILKILAGEEETEGGRVTFRKGLKVGYLPQEPKLDDKSSIIDAVLQVDNPITKAIKKYEQALENPDDQQAYQSAFDEMDRQQAWDFESRVRQVLGKLNLHDISRLIGELSGGQRKRVALAKVLIAQPGFLILDEPTNHLDIGMIEWLEEYLNQSNITLLMVTHDRYFLENICDTIIELEDNRIYQHPGSYSDFLSNKYEREEVQAVNTEKAKNLMRKELEWMRRQPKARGTKSKARIDAFHDLKKKAHSGGPEQELKLDVKMTRLGSKILELHRLRKSYGELNILDGFDYTFKKGDRVGIVGPNGVGKSTFLQLITGAIEADGGKIITGETVSFGFYTQEGMKLDGDKRVIDVIKDIAEYIPVGRKGRNITASQMLDRFLFEGDRQYTYVSKLSGGEKRRLYLLTVLMANPNFLILDEPTNDLDLLTLNVLEDFLMEFSGCLMVVTHDRYFMDKLVDHLFVFEGKGRIRDFPGSYTDYREAKKEEEEFEKRRNKSLVKAQNEEETPKEKTKLTYGERLEMQSLEEELEKLEQRRKELQLEFEGAMTDAAALESLSKEMGQLNETIEMKEMRWLELSEFEQ